MQLSDSLAFENARRSSREVQESLELEALIVIRL